MYRNVFRVPPAHVIQVTSDGAMEQRRYWSAADIRPVRLGSDAAYADGLRDASIARCAGKCAVSIQSAATQRRTRFVVSFGTCRPRALGEKPAACRVHRRSARTVSTVPCPTAVTPMKRPTSKRLKARRKYRRRHTFVMMSAMTSRELERFFIALDGPVRNPTNFGWTLAILERARAQGRRVLLGGLYGNSTISWNGWSQAASHLIRGRLLLAYRQWRLFYRITPYSRWVALRKLLLEPAGACALGDWADRRRHPARTAPWQDHAPSAPILPPPWQWIAAPKDSGMTFSIACGRDERARGLAQVDYVGDWHAAEKAVTGVEVRDPTADMDVDVLLLRRSARTISGRRHRSFVDPARHVGACCRKWY